MTLDNAIKLIFFRHKSHHITYRDVTMCEMMQKITNRKDHQKSWNQALIIRNIHHRQRPLNIWSTWISFEKRRNNVKSNNNKMYSSHWKWACAIEFCVIFGFLCHSLYLTMSLLLRVFFFRDTVHTVTFFHISEFKSIKMYNYYEFCQGLCHQTEEEEVVEKKQSK